MPLGGLLTGVGANLIGGIVGNIASGGEKAKAAAAQQAALEAIQGLSGPDADQLKVDFERYQQTGELSPQLQNVIEQKQSEMSGISTDPRLAQAQMAALQNLQKQGAGGMNAADRAALTDVQQQAAGQAQAQQASALQEMQQRGIGGAGSELAARLAAAQGASNTAMKGGLDIQGQAAQRALQAIASSGQLGQSMQAQSFGQQAQQAAAQDAINRFNAANQQQVLGQNVASQNAAQAANLAQKQQIANLNTQTAQQQAQQHAGAVQQAYQNQAQKAQMVAGAQGQQAQNNMANAAQTQQTFSGIGSAIGQGATGVSSYLTNDAAAKAKAASDADQLSAYKTRTAAISGSEA